MNLIRFRLVEQISGMQFILPEGDIPNKICYDFPGFKTRILARIAKKSVIAKKKAEIVIERIEYWD